MNMRSKKDLSISQEYLLCAVNEKGRLPVVTAGVGTCLLAGGMLELLASEAVRLDDDKKVYSNGSLHEDQVHLQSLFDWISQSKPKKIEEIAQEYAISVTGKRLKELLTGVGDSLVERGLATMEKGSFWDAGPRYIPNPEEVDRVVQKIRAELLEDGAITEETVALVSLLDKSGQLKRYFSAHEAKQLKARLEDIRNTPSNQLVKRMMDYVDMMIAVLVVTTMPH